MAIPKIIEELAHKIRTAIYGKDVRESLASGIEKAGEIAEDARKKSDETDNRQTELETRFEQQIQNMTLEDPSSAEIVDARGGETLLRHRLDKVDAHLAHIATQTRHIVNVAEFGVTDSSAPIDQTEGIQMAIDHVASLGGGEVQFNNATYYAQGLIPKNNVTLKGTSRTRLKLVNNPTNHLLYYNNDSQLINFNLRDMELDGGEQINYDVIHISRTNTTGEYTWHNSLIDNCVIQNGRVGIYCPVPGTIKLLNTLIYRNDIGIQQQKEHFYMVNTTLRANRIGADIGNGNHFIWLAVTFSHNTEIGVLAHDSGSGAFQNAFIGCTFIDNPVSYQGRTRKSRFIGCRIIDCQYGLNGITTENIVSGCEFNNISNVAITFDTIAESANNLITSSTFIGNGEDIIIIGNDHSIINNLFKATQKQALLLEGGSSFMGINIQGNTFLNCSAEGHNLYPCIKISKTYQASIIANNIFRNSSTGNASHGVLFDDEYFVVSDTLLSGNMARAMRTSGYQIKTAVTEVNNIGEVVIV